MRPSLAVMVTVILLVAGPAASGALPTGGGTPDGGSRDARACSVAPELVLISSLDARDELLEAGVEGAERGSAGHDPALMFLASLAVPGSGQLIQGNTRGYLFLVAEVALWGGFYLLESKGMDARDEYEDFADDNWDFTAYYDWYDAVCASCEGEDCADLCRPLAEYGTQEYYEDIGKYRTYWRWWTDDGDETGVNVPYSDDDLAFRDEYYDMRGDSNRHLRHARYAMMAAFLNHVAAGVDAFLTARGGAAPPTDSVGDLGLEFDVADGGDGLTCALTARY